MKKLIIFITLAVAPLISGALYADGGSASFSGVTSSNTDVLLDTSVGDAASTILSTKIKVPGEKRSLLIGVSLESSLITKTKKRGLPEACASVEVTVLLDGVPVAPGTVHFNTRCQKYDALYNEIASLCTDTSGDGLIQVADECAFSDSDIAKILATTSANHFNFIAPDVGAGKHTVEVEAFVSATAADGIIGGDNILTRVVSNVNSSSFAAINVGTLSVQALRSAKYHHHRHHHGDDDDEGFEVD